MELLPKNKPNLAEYELANMLSKFNIILADQDPVVLVGIRGYYKNSMGEPGKNDRAIYDDAFVWCIKGRGVVTFNGNCDPSKYRKGFGFGVEKGMASLDTGVWFYKTGIHNGKIPHPAFRQYGPVRVTRDGTNGAYKDSGFFGVNIHRGGANGTSSLGCQTVPPSQWDAFKALGYGAIKEYGLSHFPYILIEA